MNDFDKTFVLPFYIFFVKIELNSDKDITLILNRHTLQIGPIPGPGPLEKVDLGPLEKVDPVP